MVAVISSGNLGVFTSNGSARGTAGANGTGQNPDQVYLNTTTGNLVIQQRDESLTAVGLDLSLVRTYNSQGLMDDDNADNWRLGVYQRVYGLQGTLNAANSTIHKVFGDGSDVLYSYSTTLNKYVSTDGDGAHDTLSFNGSTWTYTDSSGRNTETYDWVGGAGKLQKSTDVDLNTLTYNYTGNLLTSVVDSSGQTTYLDYTGTNLSDVRVVSNGQTQTRTRYAYDGSNRLTQVTVDLTPADNSITDNVKYVTSYTYDGTSKRIASITQGDGTSVNFAYTLRDGDWRVTSYGDGAGNNFTVNYSLNSSGATSQTANANSAVLQTTDTQNVPANLISASLTTPTVGWSTASSTALETGATAISDAQVKFDSSGNGFALWRESANLFVRRYTAASASWGTVTTLDTRTNAITVPQLFVDGSGNSIVTWIQSDGTANSVWASRYTGGSWSTALAIDTGTAAALTPSSAINAAGQAVVVWRQPADGTTTPNNLMARRYTAGAWQAVESLETSAQDITQQPGVSIDVAGNIQVIWMQSDGTANSVFTNRFNGATGVWSGAASNVIETAATAVSDVDVAFDANGNGFALWRESANVFVRRYTASNTTWAAAVALDTRTNAITVPQLYVDGSGNAIVTWIQSDGTANSVWVSRYTGSTWSTATAIDTGTAAALMPYGVINAAGQAAVVWRQAADTTTTPNNLMARRFMGGAWQAVETLESSAQDITQQPFVAIDIDGNLQSVWQQSDGTVASVFSSRYQNDPAPYLVIPSGVSWQSLANTVYGVNSLAAGSALQSAMGNPVLTVGNRLEGFPPTINVPTTITVPSYYTVQSGDTWTSVTQAVYSTSNANAVAAFQALHVGETLTAGAHITVASTLTYSSVSYITANPAALSTTENMSVTRSYGLLNSATSNAGSVGWSSTQTIDNAGNPNFAMSPGVRFDANGNGFIVWSEGAELYVKRYDAATGVWSSEVVKDAASGAVFQSSLAVDGGGNAIVAWAQQEGSTYSAYGIFYNVSTGTWSAPTALESTTQPVTTDTYNDAVYARSIETSINGANAAIVFLQNDGTRDNLYVAAYRSGTWVAAQSVEANTNSVQEPQIKVDAAGNVVVAWAQSNGTQLQVYTNRWVASTSSWAGPTVLSANTFPAGALKVQLATGSSGNAVVTWNQSGSIRARVLNASTGVWAAEYQFVTDGQASYSAPEVAVDVNGNAIVAWIQIVNSNRNIVTSSYSTVTGTWSAPQLTSVGMVDVPSLRMLNKGPNIWVAWVQSRTDTMQFGDLYAIELTNGTASAPVVIDTMVPYNRNWSLDGDSRGNVEIVWTKQNASSSYGLYRTRFTAPYYTIPASPSWQAIANTLYGINSVAAGTALATALGNPSLTPGVKLVNLPAILSITATEAVTVPAYYVVQSGATWSSIALAVYGQNDSTLVSTLQSMLGNPALTTGLHLAVPLTIGGASTYGRTDIANGLSQNTSYLHDSSGRLARIENGIGVATEYGYDSSGNLISVKEDASGTFRETVYTYDASGNLTLSRDAAGNTVTRTYNADNQVVTETSYRVADPDGAGAGQASAPMTSRFAYDGEDHLRFTISAEGRVTEYQYNAAGQRIAMLTYASGLYNVSALTPTTTLSESQLVTWVGTQDKTKLLRTDYLYDFRGNVSSSSAFVTTDASGVGSGTASITRYVYDQRGLLLSTVDARGEATTDATDYKTVYTYDGLGRILTTTQWLANGSSRLTTMQYSDAGRQTTTTLANGLVTTSVYDAGGNLLNVAVSGPNLPGTSTTTYKYDSVGRLRFVTDATGIKQHVIYDAAGRKIAEVDGDGTLTEYIYNRTNQLVKTVRYADRLSAATVATLVDASGNPTNVTLATLKSALPTTVGRAYDQITRSVYDIAGRLVYSIDQQGAVSQQVYDGANRVTDVIQFAALVAISSATDEVAVGTVAGMVNLADVSNRVSRNFYDNDGKLIGTLDAEGYLSEYLLDPAGFLTKQVGYATRTLAQYWQAGSLSQLRPSLDVSGPGITMSGATATKSSGVNNTWDAGFRSNLSYTGSAAVSFVAAQSNQYLMVGLNTDPTTDNSYASLDWAMYCQADGTLGVYESGTYAQTLGTYAAGDVLSVTYDGTSVRYLKNGSVLRTVTAAIAQPLFADSSFYGLGAKVTDLKFGPSLTNLQNVAVGEDINSYFFYDGQGRKVGVLDAEGYLTETVYTAAGQVNSITRYGRHNASGADLGGLVYTAGDTLQSLKARVPGAAVNRTTSYLYDGAGQVTQETNFEGTINTFTYDAAGNRTNVVTAFGTSDARTTQAQYDALGRVIKELSGEGSAAIASGMSVATAWDRYGITYTYDLAGRKTSATSKPFDSIASTQQTNTTYFYYNEDNQLRFTVNALGERTENRYNALGQMTDQIVYYNRIATSGLNGGLLNATLTTQLGASADSTRDAKTSYTYTLTGQVNTSVSAEGTSITSVYTSFGQLYSSTAVDATQNAFHRYTYDRRGATVLTEWDPGAGHINRTQADSYDAFGRKTLSVDAFGNKTSATYDRLGRTVSTSDALGNAQSTLYDSFSRMLIVTDARGSLTQYQYNDATQTVTMTTPENVIVATKHNREGQTLTVTAAGNTTNYAYDRSGNLLSTSDNLGSIENRSYDTAGRQITSTDANLVVTRLAYDAANRVLTRTVDTAVGGLSLVTTYAYDGESRVMQVTEPGSKITTTSYDREGRVKDVVIDPGMGGPVMDTHYDYDNSLHTLTVTEGFGSTGLTKPRVTRYAYDALGRRVSETVLMQGTAPADLLTQYRYDANGNVTRKIDANGNSTWFVYDKDNRVQFTIDALGGVTEAVYDQNGRVTQTRQYATAVNTASFADRVASLAPVTSAQDKVMQSVFDKDGREKYSIDAFGTVTERSFDDNGNVTRTRVYSKPVAIATGGAPFYVSYSTIASIEAALVAPAAGNSLTTIAAADRVQWTAYDVRGRAAFAVQGTSSDGASASVTRYQYDANGNATAVTQIGRTYATTSGMDYASLASWSATVDPKDRVNRYWYDSANRVVFKLDAEGYLTRTLFNDASRTSTEVLYGKKPTIPLGVTTAQMMAGTNGVVILTDATIDESTLTERDAAGRTIKVTDANSNYEQFAYDAVGNKVSYRDKNGGVWNYEYDANNRMSFERSPTVAITLAVGSAVTTTARVVTAYTYDAMGNVKSKVAGSGTAQAQTVTYLYDTLGRRTQQTIAMGSSGPDLVTSYFYDSFGNLSRQTDAEGYSTWFAYDRAGRLAFTIDALGGVTGNTYGALGDVIETRRYAATTSIPSANVVYASQVSVAASNTADRVSRFVFDRLGRQEFELRLTGGTAPQFVVAEKQYNVTGEVVRTIAYDVKIAVASYADPGAVRLALGSNANAPVANDRVAESIYDRRGQSVFELAWDATGANVTRRQYDAVGNITTVKSFASQYGLGAARDVAALTSWADGDSNSASRTTRYWYDRTNRLRFSLDAERYLTESQYNDVGRQRTDVLYGRQQSSALDAATISSIAGLIATDTPTDQTSITQYDALGNTARLYDAKYKASDANYIEYTYDAVGNKTSYRNEKGAIWLYTYDANRRLLTETSPAVDVTTITDTGAAKFIGGSAVTVTGNSAIKTGGTNGVWDGGFRSSVGYVGGASVSFTAAQTNQYVMVGLNSDPATDDSYASIDYAIYCYADGSLYAYENGANAGALGSYAVGDVLSVTFDGSAVRYLKNGRVLRSLSATITQPLYADSSFLNAGTRVNGLQFSDGGNGNANIPIVASSGMSISDSSAVKSSGTDASWDAGFRSKIGYVGGAAVSFVPGQNNKYVMVGLNSDPASDNSYASMDYAMYCANDGNLYVYESGIYVQTLGPYAAGDALSVVYDGRAVSYIQNGVVLRTVAANTSQPLFADSSFYNVGAQIKDIAFFQPPFVVTNGVVVIDSTAVKTSGTDGAWDAGFRSNEGFIGGASVSFVAGQSNKYLMVGLNSDPSADSSYTSIDWAMYCQADGTLSVYESGASVQTLGTYVAGDSLSVTYDGATIRYIKNGAVLRSVAATITQPLYADSSFYHLGAKVGSLRFEGAMSTATAPQQQIVTRIAYDKNGNVVARTEASGSTQERATQYFYDALGRQVKTLFPVADVYSGGDSNFTGTASAVSTRLYTETTYDSLGNALSNRDASGNYSHRGYDSLGRVIWDVDAERYLTTYSYDSAGNAITTRRFANRVDSNIGAASITRPTVNYPSGLPIDNANDRELIKTYDRLNRVAQVITPATVNYDPVARKTYSASGLTTYVYNAFNQVTVESKAVDANRSAETYFYYDHRGLKTAEVNALGYLTTYEYNDSTGDLTRKVEYAQPIEWWNRTSYAAPGISMPPSNASDPAMRVATRFVNDGGITLIGDTATKTGGSSGAWDAGFHSDAGYAGGAAVSFTVMQANHYIMVGLNSDPASDNSYASMDYAIYCYADGSLHAYESGTYAQGLGSYTAGDSLSVTYDGTTIRYLKNGVVLRTVTAAIAQPLYADSSFLSIGGKIADLRFTGNAFVNDNGIGLGADSAIKATGSDGWDSGFHSREGYIDGAAVSFTAAQTDKYLMVGLNSDPESDASYTSIDWALYCATDGRIFIYESGVSIGQVGAYTTSDVLSVTYDGQKIRYLKNGSALREVTTTITQPLYVDSSFHSVGGKVTNLRFNSNDDNRETVYAYDQLNRKISDTQVNVKYNDTAGAILRADQTTTYGYDFVGNQTRITLVNVRSYDSASQGWVTADANTYSYYDALGRVIAIAEPTRDRGNGSQLIPLVTIKRDAFGNIVEQTQYAAGATAANESTFSASADPQGLNRVSRIAYDNYGRVVHTEDAIGADRFTAYTARGDVAKQWQAVTNSNDGTLDFLVTAYRYDALGNQVELVQPQQLTGTKTVARHTSLYNAFGEIISKGSIDGSAQSGQQEYFEYDQAGHLWRTNTGDGVTKVRLYDLAGNSTIEIESQGLNLRNYADAGTALSSTASSQMRTESVYDALSRVREQRQPSFDAPSTLEAINATFQIGLLDGAPEFYWTAPTDLGLTMTFKYRVNSSQSWTALTVGLQLSGYDYGPKGEPIPIFGYAGVDLTSLGSGGTYQYEVTYARTGVASPYAKASGTFNVSTTTVTTLGIVAGGATSPVGASAELLSDGRAGLVWADFVGESWTVQAVSRTTGQVFNLSAFAYSIPGVDYKGNPTYYPGYAAYVDGLPQGSYDYYINGTYNGAIAAAETGIISVSPPNTSTSLSGFAPAAPWASIAPLTASVQTQPALSAGVAQSGYYDYGIIDYGPKGEPIYGYAWFGINQVNLSDVGNGTHAWIEYYDVNGSYVPPVDVSLYGSSLYWDPTGGISSIYRVRVFDAAGNLVRDTAGTSYVPQINLPAGPAPYVSFMYLPPGGGWTALPVQSSGGGYIVPLSSVGTGTFQYEVDYYDVDYKGFPILNSSATGLFSCGGASAQVLSQNNSPAAYIGVTQSGTTLQWSGQAGDQVTFYYAGGGHPLTQGSVNASGANYSLDFYGFTSGSYSYSIEHRRGGVLVAQTSGSITVSTNAQPTTTQLLSTSGVTPIAGLYQDPTNADVLRWSTAPESNAIVQLRFKPAGSGAWTYTNTLPAGSTSFNLYTAGASGSIDIELRYLHANGTLYAVGSGRVDIARDPSTQGTVTDGGAPQGQFALPQMRQQLDRWGNAISSTDAAQTTTHYRYNHFNQVVQVSQPKLQTVSVDRITGAISIAMATPTLFNYYDQFDQLVGTRDGNGNNSQMRYNSVGQLIVAIDADDATQSGGAKKRSVFDAFGQIVMSTDEADYITLKSYDKTGRLVDVAQEVAHGALTPVSGLDQATIPSFLAANVVVHHYSYDEAGRRVSETTGEAMNDGSTPETIKYSYDMAGNVIRRATPRGHATTYRYDTEGRKVLETDALGSAKSSVYDYFGKVQSRGDDSFDVNEAHHSYAYNYNNYAGLLTSMTSSTGQNQVYQYDAAGHLTRIIDNAIDVNRTTEYSYDTAGRKVRVKTTDQGVVHEDTRTEYDAIGRTSLIAGLGYSVAYSYDAAGNRTHIDAHYTDGPGSSRAQDLWYQYDQMNRVSISQGVNTGGVVSIDVDATGSNNPTQGTRLTYDARGIRSSATSYGERLSITYDWKGNVVAYYISEEETDVYHYDGLGRLTETLSEATVTQAFGEPSNDPIATDVRTYDRASRVTSQQTITIESGAPVQRDRTSLYNDDGLVVLQTTTKNGVYESRLKYGDSEGDSVFLPGGTYVEYDPYYYGEPYVYTVPDSWTAGYDAAGNLRGYIVNVYNASGTHVYDSTHIYDYRFSDGYLQTTHNVLNSSGGPLGGSTYNTYNSNNELVQITDTQGPANNRYFANNAQGQALTVVKGQYDGASGRWTAQHALQNAVAGSGLFSTQSAGYFFYSADGQSVGSFSRLDGGLKANFDVNYEPISDQYPASTPQQYVVQKGDTLRLIAARVYGDAKLWYVIAQANGLTDPDAPQVEGTSLTIPNDVVSLSNTATSFKPFNVMSAIGDTTPTQPMPPPPRAHGGGCGIIGIIIIIIIIIIITIVTWGAGTAPAAEGGGAVIAGTTAASTSITLAGVAEAAAIGMAINVGSQLLMMAMGYQSSFNWKAVAAAGITAGIGSALSAVGGVAQAFGATGVTAQVVNAAATNAIGQGVNIALGLQSSFNWSSVALSAASAPLSNNIQQGVGNSVTDFTKSEFLGNFAGQFTSGVFNQTAYSLATDGKVDFARVAADSFGNALASSIVTATTQEIKESAARAKVAKAAKAAKAEHLEEVTVTAQRRSEIVEVPTIEEASLADLTSNPLADDLLKIAPPKIDIGHTVAKGDSLAKIAREYYGDERYASIIMEANGIKDDYKSIHGLKLGRELIIPDIGGYSEGEISSMLKGGGRTIAADRAEMDVKAAAAAQAAEVAKKNAARTAAAEGIVNNTNRYGPFERVAKEYPLIPSVMTGLDSVQFGRSYSTLEGFSVNSPAEPQYNSDIFVQEYRTYPGLGVQVTSTLSDKSFSVDYGVFTDQKGPNGGYIVRKATHDESMGIQIAFNADVKVLSDNVITAGIIGYALDAIGLAGGFIKLPGGVRGGGSIAAEASSTASAEVRAGGAASGSVIAAEAEAGTGAVSAMRGRLLTPAMTEAESAAIGVPVIRSTNRMAPVREFDIQGNEILYRTMPEEKYELFLQTNKMPGSGETSMSPVQGYAEAYSGVTVRITLKPGTSALLQEIGIAADTGTAAKMPNLSVETGSWNMENARFKAESGQMTTQVGRGKGLDIINSNIVKFEEVRPNFKYPQGHKPGSFVYSYGD